MWSSDSPLVTPLSIMAIRFLTRAVSASLARRRMAFVRSSATMRMGAIPFCCWNMDVNDFTTSEAVANFRGM